jgi:hypothetical protein
MKFTSPGIYRKITIYIVLFRLSNTGCQIILTALDKYAFLNDRRALRQMATNAKEIHATSRFYPVLTLADWLTLSVFACITIIYALFH